jgi:16S rRNA (guanine527-N7)-methyltransferase
VTRREVRDRLLTRLEHAGVPLSSGTLEALETYYWLLARWNPKVNLTALPLDPPRDETFDRLFVEPIVAAGLIQPAPSPRSPVPAWLDLGSGGGSPAIPLKVMRPYWALTMVESKERKAAFLREAARALRFRDAEVVNARFEELDGSTGQADLITVRAVKLDQQLAASVKRLLNPTGIVAVFGTGELELHGFETVTSSALIPDSSAALTVFRVPRGT